MKKRMKKEKKLMEGKVAQTKRLHPPIFTLLRRRRVKDREREREDGRKRKRERMRNLLCNSIKEKGRGSN